MSVVHLRHIRKRLEKDFTGRIDLADCSGKPPEDTDSVFLTRAQAAYALVTLTGLRPDAAARCVVDGYMDNGIDAICHDADNATLYLVQSKWHGRGTGS